MSKKVIIISAISIIVIAGVAIAALLLLRPQTVVIVKTNSDSMSPDLAVDYGACSLLEKDFIKLTLGSTADNLQGPDDMGRIYLKNGDQSQPCIYSFIVGGTMENSFNASNGFSVEVYKFKDQASLDTRLAVKNDSEIVVTGIGESANFVNSASTVASPDAEPTDYTKNTLTVYAGLKSYTYSISEPTKSATFTTQTAQTALTTLAQRVSYKQ
jgi:hypothetical protein